MGRPGWWLILFFIPLACLVIALIVLDDLSKSFGKGAGSTIGLFFLGFIFSPMLGFGSGQCHGQEVARPSATGPSGPQTLARSPNFA